MNEIWKPIEGTDGKYEVSNTGKVRSLNYKQTGKAKELTPSEKAGGYLQLRVKIDGKLKTVVIHRLVAEAFVPNPDGKPEVNHINGNKKRNYADNLEWVTRSENIQHAVDSGLRDRVAVAASKRGKVWIRELHKMQKTPVIAINVSTGERTEFQSQQEAAEALHLQKGHISSVIHGKRRQTGGYTFVLKREGGDAHA